MFVHLSPPLRCSRIIVATVAGLLLLVSAHFAAAVDGISSNAAAQISALIAEKQSRTAAQLKMDSQILYALKVSRNQPIAAGISNLQFLPILSGSNGLIKVDIDGTVSSNLLASITGAGGQIVASVPRFDSIRALIPIAIAEQLAGRSDVRFINVATEPHRNTGSVDTEGDATQNAALARSFFGVDGSGVKVGVLSDSVDFLNNSVSTGDLPPDVTVLPGQSGVPDTGEGTAMLEIIHDIAPGAQLYFATANGGAANFAQNILNLAAAGCDIIVDDVFYFTELCFQDGIVARAVNTVTTNGALFFSACGNAGNKKDGTSTVWEGDFLDGGPAGTPVNGRSGNYHSFGAANYTTVTAPGGGVYLFWADPLNASTNDYDLFVLDSTGATVLGASTTVQNGTVTAFEGLNGNLAVGLRVVIVKVAGDNRFMHLDAILGQLQDNTAGWARGHAAATNAFSVAAVDVATAFPASFIGGAQNPVENFTSDGPRRMFFQADGTAITPTNFTSTGGAVRQYPVITASDGVSTAVPGFSPFFGTSAAAPHAAAIAALVKSYNPTLTPGDVRNVLTSTALDIEAPGVDINSGYGLVMADRALRAAPLVLNLAISTNILSGGNGNGIIDYNECNNLDIVLVNRGPIGATNVQATLTTTSPGVIVAQRTSAYPDLPKAGGTGTNLTHFKISTSPAFICGTPLDLSLSIKCDQGTLTNQFQLSSGTNGLIVRFNSSIATNIPDNNPSGVSSPVTVSNIVGAIADVSVSLFITHTFDGDLKLELIAPDGTTAVLSGNHGGSGQNYGVNCTPDSSRTTFSDSAITPISSAAPPFIGTFSPDQSLSRFTGKSGTNINGIWKLHVVDSAQFDVGTIQCWSLSMAPAGCIDGGGQCPGVDLSIGMSAAPEPVFVGSNLVYTIRVTNSGPDTAKSTVISQVLPPSVVFVSASVSQGSIGQAGGVVTASIGNMSAGAIVVATVVVTPTSAGLISSSASVTSNNQDFDTSNNGVTITSHINPPFADLAVGLDAAPNPVLVGQTLTYSVSLTNRGPSAASGTIISNVLPTSVGILAVNPSQGFATISGNVVVLNLGTIASGGRVTATIDVNPTLQGTITASATASANQTDPVLENNSTSISTVVGPATDLTLGMVANPSPVVLRSNVTYIISVTNRGPSVATSVVVNDALPSGVTLVSSNTTLGSISVSGTAVTANLGSMTNGATATISLTIRTGNAGTIVNSASISGAQSDPNTSNNSASVSTLVSSPFVSILPAGATLTAESLSPPNGTVDLGETVTVQLRLRNVGNVANTNLIATLQAGNGVTAPSSPQSYGSLAASGFPVAKPFSFTASGTNGGTVIVTLSLQDVSGTTTNNLGSVSFTFSLPSVASFSNTNRIDIPTASQDQQFPGPASPYPSPITVSGVSGIVGKVTATLNNLNHTFPHDINVLLTGPSGTATVLMSDCADASSVSGANVTFDDSAEGPLASSGQISSGSFKPSAYDVSPAFTSPAPAAPYNTALSVFNGPSPNGTWSLFANDDSQGDFGSIAGGWTLSITTLTPVNQLADLVVASTTAPTSVFVGSNLTNTFNISNNGPSAAASVAFTNTIPTNASLVSVSTSQGTVVINGSTLVLNLGSLGPASNAVVKVILSPTSAGSVTNVGTAAAASGEIDLNSANNSAAAVATAILPQTDIGLSSVATPNPVVTGSNFTVSVTVTNLGTNNALNVVVSNALPAGVDFVFAFASQGLVSYSGGNIVASLGTIRPSATATLTFTVTANVAGSLTNTSRVTTRSSDGNSANDAATIIVVVADPAPAIQAAGANIISEGFVPANAAVDAGETVTVSLTLTNAGVVDAGNLVATLLATGGVTSPGGPVTYGPVSHGGAAVSRNFSFTAGAPPSGVVTATLQLQDGANNLGTVTFTFPMPVTTSYSNSIGIVIPDHGPGTPYPSTIAVSGLTGVVSKATVSLNGLSHSFPHDVNILLVSPSGQKVTVLSHAGGGHSVTNLTISLDDAASSTLTESGALTDGTFKPAVFGPAATFPAPAPGGPSSSTLSTVNGSNPNGNWSLYVLDDSVGDAGSIGGGWSLSLTTVKPVAPIVNLMTTLSATPNPVYVGSLLTYRLTLTNIGPNTATGVLLIDNLPPGVTLVSSNSTSGSFSLIGGGVVLNAGSLASGAGLTATLGVTSSSAGTLTNTATASAAQTDLDPANDTAKVLTTVLTPAPARLSIVALTNGQFEISVTAEPGQVYNVQGATNLASWSPIFTGTSAPNGTFKFTTTNAQSFNYRFFRSVRIP